MSYEFLHLFSLSIITILHALAPLSNKQTDIIQHVRQEKLYQSKQWLNLLHYQGDESVVDDTSSFFFSPQGHHNPQAEMIAYVKALFQSDQLADQHAICRFPARFHYLLQQIDLTPVDFPHPWSNIKLKLMTKVMSWYFIGILLIKIIFLYITHI